MLSPLPYHPIAYSQGTIAYNDSIFIKDLIARYNYIELTTRATRTMNISFVKTSIDIEVYINDEFTFVIDVVDINSLDFEDVYYELKRSLELVI